MPDSYRTQIVASPQVMAGKPVIKGTRIPVELIVRLVAQGLTEKDILRDYPSLEQTDIQAALWYAVALLNQEHGDLWEDFYDAMLAKARADEPRESLDEVRQRLTEQGRTSLLDT